MEVGEKVADVDHATTIFDLTLWTTKQLKSAANLTQYAPSAKDLLLAGPRMGMRLGSLVFKLPHTIDDAFGARWAQSVAPEALDIGRVEVTSNAATMMGEMAQSGSAIMNDPANLGPSLTTKISLESGRSFGNMVAYATSRWSLGCFLMAIIVNRTQVYASTQVPTRWHLFTLIKSLTDILFNNIVASSLQPLFGRFARERLAPSKCHYTVL